jgi:hypothetical protein
VNSYNNGGQYITDETSLGHSASTGVAYEHIAPRTQYINKPEGMSDKEYQGYLATCQESYDITQRTFALYTLHPNVLYAI